jgi:signal peptidase I
VLAFLIKTFIMQAFFIPSGSMVPALEVGDRVLVEKVTYLLRSPQRAEVIVFQRPGAERPGGVAGAGRAFLEGLGVLQPDDDVDLIKRVIGLPGETIEVIGGQVHVEGEALVERDIIPDGRDFEPVTVPDGHYYMLGDNRTNSDDSRWELGTVPEDNVVGRAFVILWPPGNAAVSLREDYATP